MKMNFKKNGGGYISGCTIAFGSKEMKDLNLIDKDGNLKEIEYAKSKNENELIIKLKERMSNMIKIKERNIKYVNSIADYQLEDGTLLFEKDWNGEIYGNGFKDNKHTNLEYKPVYRFQLDNVDLNNLEENSDEWNYESEIVGFEEI